MTAGFSLECRCSEIDDSRAAILADELPGYPTVTRLDLRDNTVGDAGARALAAALPATAVAELNLGYNYIGADGASALATAAGRASSLRGSRRAGALAA